MSIKYAAMQIKVRDNSMINLARFYGAGKTFSGSFLFISLERHTKGYRGGKHGVQALGFVLGSQPG